MSTDHRAQVDELLADYRRSQERLATTQQELAAITETVRSQDGSVQVTVGPQGVLQDLVVDEAAYQRQRPAQLAATIVRLTKDAALAAAARAQEVLVPVLPADADPAAIFGRADVDPAPEGSDSQRSEPQRNDSRRADDNHDDEVDPDFSEERGWLQDSAGNGRRR